MIFAVSMVKDEADIIGTTVGHLLAEGVDRILVLDNGSTDDTRQILEGFAEVTVYDDPEVGYYQSRKISSLAEDARCLGAEWVIPFDADEMWYAPHGRLADVLDGDVMRARTYAHVPLAGQCDGLSPWREPTQKQLPKVAFRPAPDLIVADGNHEVARSGIRVEGVLQIREFQYRSFEHLARKVRNGKRALEQANLPPSIGTHWRQLGALDDDALRATWDEMTARTDLVYDPAPIRC